MPLDPEPELLARGRTAMTRTDLSRPVSVALEDGVLSAGRSVLDYGCGRGGDVRRLSALGYDVSGWDPVFAPDHEPRPADVVNLGYVINVIESPQERADVLRRAWEFTRRTLIVAARPDWEARDVAGRRHGDGLITSKGTFQRFYAQHELRSWIEETLGEASHAASPGIFYVFRDPRDSEGLRARQVRQGTATPLPRLSQLLYEQHEDLLTALVDFLSDRGRLPEPEELPEGEALLAAFGSVRHAFAVVRRATGRHDWSRESEGARNNLLVYLALASFSGRPRMSGLPDDVQRDVKALCGSYRAASNAADALLFSLGSDEDLEAAIRTLPCGKLLPDSVYIHKSALSFLPPLMRVYEGCARALIGRVSADIVKLHRQQRKVSYLFYPEFERLPHPALAASFRVDLQSFHVRFRDFRASRNPPILHRKDAFVHPSHPSYGKFARLTQQEERADLLGLPGIGTRLSWERFLEEEGWRLAGHRLLRAPAPPAS